MKLIKPSFALSPDKELDGMGMLRRIEAAGRTCYKSEDKITDDSAVKFVQNIMKRGHLSVIEHESISVRFIIDRGVSHELVRHRLCAFSQESTRYVKYDGETEFIIPPWVNIQSNIDYLQGCPLNEAEYRWVESLKESEAAYCYLLKRGWQPQQARSVLPNSLKTEIVTTCNLREWRHILALRTSKAKAHPQIREVMVPLLAQLKQEIPVIFEDIDGG
jgi:thymidylate synthase (FAD)